MSFQTCLCRTQKKILWSTVFVHKMKVKTTLDPIDFYCMYKQHWHSSNYFQLFSTDERKLEKFQGWANDRTSIFWLNYPFNKLLRSDWNDLGKKKLSFWTAVTLCMCSNAFICLMSDNCRGTKQAILQLSMKTLWVLKLQYVFIVQPALSSQKIKARHLIPQDMTTKTNGF